ncbi:MAG: hypothetical protein AAB540_03790, partial [Patescibacteria group bacterium]
MENSSPEIQKFKDQVEALQDQISDSDLEQQEKSDETLRASLIGLTDTIYEDISTFRQQNQISKDEETAIEALEQQLKEIKDSLNQNDVIYDSTTEKMVKDKDTDERRSLALSTHKPEILAVLARDEDTDTRRLVAYSEDTPPEILAVLAKDKDLFVIKTVASREDTPPGLFEVLAKDKTQEVRRAVAFNPHTPYKLLEVLVKDWDPWEKSDLASQTHSPKLLAILANDPNPKVREAVAFNFDTPPEVLEVLTRDKDTKVRG